ncbi:MAG: alpha/beta hydrolase [Myxococcota bacterium]
MRATGAGDVELATEELPGDGPPVVLVMGLGAQMLLWPDAFCEQLAALGHRVIRYDNRDVGLSSRCDSLGAPNVLAGVVRARLGISVRAPYSLTDMADDAIAVLDAYGLDRACFVGASMGGMIVQRVAIHHAPRVAGFVSIMSAPGPSRPRNQALRALLKPPAPGRDGYIDNFVSTFRAIGSQTHPLPEDRVRALGARCYERDPSKRGFARQLTAILAEPDRYDGLRACEVPALVIHGAQDPLIPLTYGIQTAKLLGCRLEVHAEMGHDLPPVVWDDIVGSISRHATAHADR